MKPVPLEPADDFQLGVGRFGSRSVPPMATVGAPLHSGKGAPTPNWSAKEGAAEEGFPPDIAGKGRTESVSGRFMSASEFVQKLRGAAAQDDSTMAHASTVEHAARLGAERRMSASEFVQKLRGPTARDDSTMAHASTVEHAAWLGAERPRSPERLATGPLRLPTRYSPSAAAAASPVPPRSPAVDRTIEGIRTAGSRPPSQPALNAVLDEQLVAIASSWWRSPFAVGEGDVAAIGRLVAEGASPNAKHHEIPVVVMAALKGHAGVVSVLARLGADLDATDRDGQTALMAAACKGKVECARALLDAGADRTLRATECERETALEMAENAGYGEGPGAIMAAEVAVLLGTQSEQLRQEVLDKQVSDAAKEGDAAAIERLVVEGASPNAKGNDSDRTPAVVTAALSGHVGAVAALLRLGADINARYSNVNGHQWRELGDETALMRAAQRGRVEDVRALLAAGADCTLRRARGEDGREGMTALEMAEEKEPEPIDWTTCLDPESPWSSEEEEDVRSRVEGKAEVAALLAALLSPAEKAEWEQRKAAKAQAALDWQLLKAASKGDEAAIERLAAEGASLAWENPWELQEHAPVPVVCVAAVEGHAGAVSALARLGADLDARWDGQTALMAAACNGKVECARALLDAGADRTLRATDCEWEGKTALEMAEEEGKAEVAALF
eukprot:COSAG01_NODE_3599_length_5889_cov_19.716580_2_plen_676_part_00